MLSHVVMMMMMMIREGTSNPRAMGVVMGIDDVDGYG